MQTLGFHAGFTHDAVVCRLAERTKLVQDRACYWKRTVFKPTPQAPPEPRDHPILRLCDDASFAGQRCD